MARTCRICTNIHLMQDGGIDTRGGSSDLLLPQHYLPTEPSISDKTVTVASFYSIL